MNSDAGPEFAVGCDRSLQPCLDGRAHVNVTDLVPERARVLWVASTGGHLAELHALATRTIAARESMWLTFDTAQSRDLLAESSTRFVPYVGPRDGVGALRTGKAAAEILRGGEYDLCISTGAAIAATVLPIAASSRTPAVYLESLARVTSPSMSGRILAFVPGVRTYSQYRSWSSRTWRYGGSLLNGWRARSSDDVGERPLHLFVTLGTMRRYRFDRAVDAVLKILRPGDEIRWQLGATSREGLPGEASAEMTYGAITDSIEWADVVLSHGGVGTILDCLSRGKMPVMLARSAVHGEHVDEHQSEFVLEMTRRGLGVELSLSTPQRADLLRATATSINSD